MKKSYRGGLPKPDAKGYYRPEVGGKRFTVGHKRDVSEGEALRRTNAVRELFDRQCEHHKIDFWAGWILPWAQKLARGEMLTYQVTDDARKNPGQASEKATLIELLRSFGLDVTADNPATIARGERQLKQWIRSSRKSQDLVGEVVSVSLGQPENNRMFEAVDHKPGGAIPIIIFLLLNLLRQRHQDGETALTVFHPSPNLLPLSRRGFQS